MSVIPDIYPIPEFSIVVPAYNEGIDPNNPDSLIRYDAFCKNLDGLLLAADKISSNNEVLVINDGSTDNTATIAKRLGADVYAQTDGLNLGKGAALKLGLSIASGDVRAFADADGAVSPDSVMELVTTVQEQDVDIAVVRRSGDGHGSQLRKMGHILMEKSCDFLAATGVKDTQAGAKAFTAETIDLVLDHVNTEGYALIVIFCTLHTYSD